MKIRCLVTAVAALALLTAAAPPAAADDAKKDLKALGKDIAEAGKEVGETVADAARHVYYKGKKVSIPLLKKVQTKTKEFWDKAVAGTDEAIQELREENRKLRDKLAERGRR